jgi:hypothetical protein
MREDISVALRGWDQTNIPDPRVLRFALYPELFYFTLSA